MCSATQAMTRNRELPHVLAGIIDCALPTSRGTQAFAEISLQS